MPEPKTPAQIPFRLWTPEERQASMEDALRHRRPDEDVWIFGYGSLIWRPEFEYVERRLATLRGYHRALCLWSRINRGTPESPGLVFGLDRGGSCRGVVYRMDSAQVPAFFPQLWRREMSTGAYLPRWLSCATDDGPVKGLVFVMNRSGPAYIPALPEDEILAIVRRASGQYGPCMDYVLQTAEALRQSGIHDRRLMRVARLLAAERHTLPDS
ncbi:gamma-glutamylcyclotransferase [Bordetella genomosp. 9]|nr:gamma-glutamylcyclotransferase [Bordetella genomosp. 9]